MLAEPKCWKRKCKHYLGIIQPDGTEMTEINNCKAFLKISTAISGVISSHFDDQVIKLLAREPITNAQPSTNTNNIILKGKEIISGDNIIIPIAIKTLATTKSIIKNGINNKKPI